MSVAVDTVLSDRKVKLLSYLISLGVAAAVGWLFALLLVGRALPWQASRWWVAIYAAAFAVSALWWRRFLSRAFALAKDPRNRIVAAWWGTALPLGVALAVLPMAYASDGFYSLLRWPYWRMPLIAAVVLLFVLTESLQVAAVEWLGAKAGGPRAAVQVALRRRGAAVVLLCLAGIGVLQATAGVVPFGDDLGKYIYVAYAFLDKQPYPVARVGPDMAQSGIGDVYPALPTLPALLALSFSLFGRNEFALALPTVVATALFPLAMYAACSAVTGSRRVAFVSSLLLYLFPIYQIHVLGAPEPDTVFVTLLLAGAALSAKARQGDWRYWVAMGATMGAVTLTRFEGMAYSAICFVIFFLFHRPRRKLGLSLAAYLVVLAPFVLAYRSVTGLLWPPTFGPKILGWRNFEVNLNTLSWAALPWYSQAVGLGKEALVWVLLLAGFVAAAGAVTIWWQKRELVWVPASGLGHVVSALFIHPDLLFPASPIEFMRHTSYGVPFAVISIACGGRAAFRWVVSRFPRVAAPLSFLTALVVCLGLYYEAERLARPEWYFEGHASLLWTGGFYLLTDLSEHPVPLALPGDPRTGEEIRRDLAEPLEDVNLKRVNRSEPYHWTSLMLALFGLAYCFLATHAPEKGAPPAAAARRSPLGL